MPKRWRLDGNRQAPAKPRVRAGALHAALVRGHARAAKHEQAYVDALRSVFDAEARDVARRFSEMATPHAMTAAAANSASTMVAVYPELEQAGTLVQPNGEPVEILHCTLAFLGDTTIDEAEQAAALLRAVAAELGPLSGEVGGVASFGSETGVLAEVARVAGLVAPDGGYGETAYDGDTSTVWWNPADWTSTEEADAAVQAFLAIPKVEGVEVAEAESGLPGEPWQVVYAGGRPLVEPSYPSIVLPDVPYLADLRAAVCAALTEAGISYSTLHGWTPHITVAYTREPSPPPADLLGLPLSFDRLYLTRGDIPRGYPLGQALALAAAGEPPEWSPPHPDEVFQPAKFIDKVRTKTDPIRQAAIQAATAEGLNLAGIDFDITNPLVAGVLERTGAKVTNVTDTTRAGIMRTIGTAYDQGLSIPDTAKLLREAIDGASQYRSEMIARTEMAGLVNGGDVAATRIVSEETGVAYEKQWLVGGGAEYPRHELYDGLDGQTVGLEEYFDVGGDQLAYPGDPDGSPEETINCRCTVIMLDQQGADTGDEIEAE